MACSDYPHQWTASTTPNALTIPVHLHLSTQIYEFTALIDTGCSVPLLMRDGILPQNILQPAPSPIQLGTATGDPMSGGNLGFYGDLILPVTLRSKHIRFKMHPCLVLHGPFARQCHVNWLPIPPITSPSHSPGHPFNLVPPKSPMQNASTHTLTKTGFD